MLENPKSFWSYVRSRRTTNIGIPSLYHQGKLCTSPREKAESLNSYFQSVFTKETGNPTSFPQPSPYREIGHLHVHRPGVEKQLLRLDPSKACGPDEVSPRLLKIVALEISPALSFLFQQSFNTGIVPQQWKQALVAPIFKSGERSNPSNYRPISLTCICSKIMEHIVLSHISKHVASNNILYAHQHGFRQKLSTTTQLISATHDWAHTLHLKGQTDIIFLDFQKAFDRVSHHLLRTKLDFYGIRRDTLRWVMALLSNRQQAVVVNGMQSSWKDVTSGVPQGSVIGPALFLLYINDIHDNIKSTTRLFADDGIVYREINTEMDHKTL